MWPPCSGPYWSTSAKCCPVGVLAAALSGIVEALTNDTDPRAGLTRFLVAGVLALAALFVTFLIQYKALYEATYRESANRRIRLAEVLRQLPLSFFGNRDLTDLTTTIMGDTETLEKAFSHFYPAMHGALISTGADFRRHAALRLADGAGSFVGGACVAADGLSLPAHGKAAYKEGSRHPSRSHRRHAGGAGVRAGRSRRATKRRGISPTWTAGWTRRSRIPSGASCSQAPWSRRHSLS